MEQKVCQLRQLAAGSKPRTPLSARAPGPAPGPGLPSLHSPRSGNTKAAGSGEPGSWGQEEIKKALQVRAGAGAGAAAAAAELAPSASASLCVAGCSLRVANRERFRGWCCRLLVQACGMHVGQALLALQDSSYRPGDIKAGLQQRRLRSPRAGARRGLSSPRTLGETTDWSARPLSSGGKQPKPPSLPAATVHGQRSPRASGEQP
jgi:hypothetical protein